MPQSHTEEGSDGRPVVVASSLEQHHADLLLKNFTGESTLVFRKRKRKGYCRFCEKRFVMGEMSVALQEPSDGRSKPAGFSFHPHCWERIRVLLPDEVVEDWIKREK